MNIIQKDEYKIYGQFGEDGIIQKIIRNLKIKQGICVEIGTGNGYECNTRNLIQNYGWTGIMFDKKESESWNNIKNNGFMNIHQVRFDTSRTIKMFRYYNVPETFDLLSIDIDGIDYYILKEIIEEYKPKIIVLEYNGQLPKNESLIIQYDPKFKWDGTYYFGASLKAYIELLKDYKLVYCMSQGFNAFFVHKKYVKHPKDWKTLFVPNHRHKEILKNNNEWVSL